MQLICFAVDSVKAQMLGHLLVADLHCSQIRALVKGAQLPVLAREDQGDPLAWISRGLRQRRAEGDPPRVLHLIAHGRPSSNLYSGTEMLGALSGFENLLQDQARRGGDDPAALHLDHDGDRWPA